MQLPRYSESQARQNAAKRGKPRHAGKPRQAQIMGRRGPALVVENPDSGGTGASWSAGKRLGRRAGCSLVRVLQDELVQRRVRHSAFGGLQLAILFLELLEPADLRHTHPHELPLPPVEGLLADSQLAARHPHRRPALRPPQRERDLIVRKPRLLHRSGPRTGAE
jgi:hypothetical protein